MRIALASSFVFFATTTLLNAQEIKRIEGFHFNAKALGGQTITQDQFKDGVLLVDLWGIWCPPCRQAVPKLVDLYAKYKPYGLEIVGFNYASDGSPDEVDKVRKFAVENHITYTLAAAPPEIRDQVPGFSGYPTMLFFGPNLKHEHSHVGFSEGNEVELEKWIREALGLDGDKKQGPAKELTPEEKEKQEDAKEEQEVPKGAIWKPGHHDKGFDFELVDVDGKKLNYEDLRTRPLVLALMTTWDQNATRTTAFLNQLQTDFADANVLAGFYEKGTDQDKKVEAVRSYRVQHGMKLRAFTYDLKFTASKVYRFAALPTILVFAAEGTLVLREEGISDEISSRVRDTVGKLVAK